MVDLVTITSDGGTRLRVARDQAQRMLDTLNNIEMRYPVNPAPQETAGFNFRNVAGTPYLSEHARGYAFDVNATQNARGTQGDIRRYFTPGELSSQPGMRWGGTFKDASGRPDPDDMHFEVARGAEPAPLGSSSARLPASAGLNEVSEAGPQPLSLLPQYRAPFTAPAPEQRIASAAPTRQPQAELPPPPAAMPPPTPPPAQQPPPFAQPRQAQAGSGNEIHDQKVAEAMRTASGWKPKPLPASIRNPYLFGGAA